MDASETIDSAPLAKGTELVEYFKEDWGKMILLTVGKMKSEYQN
jgi:hypothetical protein